MTLETAEFSSSKDTNFARTFTAKILRTRNTLCCSLVRAYDKAKSSFDRIMGRNVLKLTKLLGSLTEWSNESQP